jgi:hypothetical protein
MLELTFLILMRRLASWGREPVVARRAIDADAATLFGLVSDPARSGDAIHPLLRPTVCLRPSDSRRLVFVSVRFGRRDALRVTWMLTPRGRATVATLSAELTSGSPLARLALALGARRRLQQRLDDILAGLAAPRQVLCPHERVLLAA